MASGCPHASKFVDHHHQNSALKLTLITKRRKSMVVDGFSYTLCTQRDVNIRIMASHTHFTHNVTRRSPRGGSSNQGLLSLVLLYPLLLDHRRSTSLLTFSDCLDLQGPHSGSPLINLDILTWMALVAIAVRLALSAVVGNSLLIRGQVTPIHQKFHQFRSGPSLRRSDGEYG